MGEHDSEHQAFALVTESLSARSVAAGGATYYPFSDVACELACAAVADGDGPFVALTLAALAAHLIEELAARDDEPAEVAWQRFALDAAAVGWS